MKWFLRQLIAHGIPWLSSSPRYWLGHIRHVLWLMEEAQGYFLDRHEFPGPFHEPRSDLQCEAKIGICPCCSDFVSWFIFVFLFDEFVLCICCCEMISLVLLIFHSLIIRMSLVCDLAPALALEAGRWCYGTSSASAVVNGPSPCRKPR